MITFTSFTPEWSDAVRQLNQRLIDGGLDRELCFPEEPVAEFSTRREDPVWQDFFLAVDGDVVRGGYFLTHETWCLEGQSVAIANYRLPVSDGLVNEAFRGVALAIHRHALKQQPLLYCLGMGSYERPFPRTLRAMKWPMHTTPFFFKCMRPSRVLRNLPSMRRTAARRLALDVAAFTGAASVGVRLWQSLRSRSAPACETTVVDDFGPWTDELWERVHGEYLMLARRDAATLRARYPRTDRRFIRVQIGSNGRVIGHAVLLDTQMSGNKHFGNLRVGTLVDCFGSPADADCIVTAAAAVLARRGVDVIIANQCHTAWCDAFRRAGFLEGPSNRIFAASPQLAARLLQPFKAAVGRMHLTRGDAAGPIHL